jgi:hypothetical protein
VAEIKIVKSSDLARCPIRSFDPKHYHPSGACRCSAETKLDAHVKAEVAKLPPISEEQRATISRILTNAAREAEDG